MKVKDLKFLLIQRQADDEGEVNVLEPNGNSHPVDHIFVDAFTGDVHMSWKPEIKS